jgi:DNA-binding response OmpR family regulator
MEHAMQEIFSQVRQAIQAIVESERKNLAAGVLQMSAFLRENELRSGRVRRLTALKELLEPFRHAANASGWSDGSITPRITALYHAAEALGHWDDPDWALEVLEYHNSFIADPPTLDVQWHNLQPFPDSLQSEPDARLEELVANVQEALDVVAKLANVSGPALPQDLSTKAPRSEAQVVAGAEEEIGGQTTEPDKDDFKPKIRQGQLGISLNYSEHKATRNGASAFFGARQKPWKLFVALCRRHPAPYTKTGLQDDIWGKGQGDDNTLFAHITSLRQLIEPLSLTVTCERNIGYRLVELPTKTRSRGSRKKSRKPQRR